MFSEGKISRSGLLKYFMNFIAKYSFSAERFHRTVSSKIEFVWVKVTLKTRIIQSVYIEKNISERCKTN